MGDTEPALHGVALEAAGPESSPASPLPQQHCVQAGQGQHYTVVPAQPTCLGSGHHAQHLELAENLMRRLNATFSFYTPWCPPQLLE